MQSKASIMDVEAATLRQKRQCFQLGSARLSLMVDVFNLLNLNKSLSEFDISGPVFPQRRPLDLENPRAFRLGLRLSF